MGTMIVSWNPRQGRKWQQIIIFFSACWKNGYSTMLITNNYSRIDIGHKSSIGDAHN
jgi:hypothetical protein